MNPKDITRAMEDGYTFVCATCPKLHVAKERGLPFCLGNVDGKSCAGPLGNSDYPEYTGPLKDNMTARCFLTGQESVGAVDVRGTLIGVSEHAIKVLETYSRKGGGPPPFITRKRLPVLG